MNAIDNDKLVSIIIPVFNVRPFLIEALDSVLDQTYRNLEIIVINDGSTDGSGKICDEYARKDVRVVVIHQENKGLSSARNAGLKRMSGEIVAFLDSDDAYHPDYINTMMDTMMREKADLVICRYTLHYTTGRMRDIGNEKQRPMTVSGLYDRVSALRTLAAGTLNVNVWNKLYKRELWKNIRFRDGHVYEDNEVAYKIIDVCKRVYVIDASLYLHRKWDGSITATWLGNHFCDKIFALSIILSFIEEHMQELFASEIEKQGIIAKAAYGMVIRYPWMLRIVFPLYRIIQMYVWRILER